MHTFLYSINVIHINQYIYNYLNRLLVVIQVTNYLRGVTTNERFNKHHKDNRDVSFSSQGIRPKGGSSNNDQKSYANNNDDAEKFKFLIDEKEIEEDLNVRIKRL